MGHRRGRCEGSSTGRVHILTNMKLILWHSWRSLWTFYFIKSHTTESYCRRPWTLCWCSPAASGQSKETKKTCFLLYLLSTLEAVGKHVCGLVAFEKDVQTSAWTYPEKVILASPFFSCSLASVIKTSSFKWNFEDVLTQSELHFLNDKLCIRNNFMAFLWMLLIRQVVCTSYFFTACKNTFNLANILQISLYIIWMALKATHVPEWVV